MRLVSAFALSVATLVAACGGSTFAGNDDGGPGGGEDSGPGSDSGAPPDGGGVACPSSAPGGGTPCPSVGLECEYGTNVNPSCNSVAQCTASGWMYSGGINCPAGMCPASYGSTADCSSQGLLCSYPQGTCACGFGFGPPVLRDGGGPFWTCGSSAPGCPEPRPDIGSACSTEGQMCDYAACEGGVALQCTGGAWKRTFLPCPA
jgi:hypothetical protein